MKLLILIFGLSSIADANMIIENYYPTVKSIDIHDSLELKEHFQREDQIEIIDKIVPDGTNNNRVSKECSYDEIKKFFPTGKSQAGDKIKKVQNWYESCKSQISDNSDLALLDFGNIQYEIEKNKAVKSIRFELDNNTKVRGLIALKKSDKALPLVLAICGLYCDVEDNSVTHNFIMHYFDESPFHLLALNSFTGKSFAQDNQRVGLGGVFEAEVVLKIVEELRKDPVFSKKISNIHIHGVSLGGNTASMTAVLASQRENRHLGIQSASAVCPVIELQQSMQDIFDDSLRGGINRFVTLNHLNPILKDLPTLQTELGSDEVNWLWSNQRLYRALSQAAMKDTQKQTQTHPYTYAPFKGLEIIGEEDFWFYNDFKNFFHEIKIPMMVVYADDDFIVLPKNNSIPLREELGQNPNDYIGVMGVEKGSHCAFSFGIGWDSYSSLLRSFLLKNSEGLEDLKYQRHLLESSIRLGEKERVSKIKWLAKLGSDEAELEIEVLTDRSLVFQKDCDEQELNQAPQKCYRSELSSFSLHKMGIEAPSTQQGAEALTRFLNTNSVFYDENQEKVLGQSRVPKQFDVFTKVD